MTNLARIQRACKVFNLLILGLSIGLPILTIAYWITFNSLDWPLPRVLEQWIFKPYASDVLVTGFLITLLPGSLIMYGLFQLHRLFQLYRAGMIFTHDNCQCLLRLSLALIAWPPIGMLFDGLITYFITTHNPAGSRLISIGVQVPDLTLLILGGVFLVITWVMHEGCCLADDQAQII